MLSSKHKKITEIDLYIKKSWYIDILAMKSKAIIPFKVDHAVKEKKPGLESHRPS